MIYQQNLTMEKVMIGEGLGDTTALMVKQMTFVIEIYPFREIMLMKIHQSFGCLKKYYYYLADYV